MTISFIIPEYGNQDYTEACTKSLEATVDGNECWICDTGINFSNNVNIGVKRSKGDIIVILNNDLLFSKGWLEPLLETHRKTGGIVNPLSNCDKGWRHNYNLNGWLPGVHKLGDINPQEVYDFQSPSTRVYQVQWVPFFCTLMSREIYDKVGLLDELYNNGCEDLDYCIRAKQLGITCWVDERSFVFHYGAISRKSLEAESSRLYHQQDIENHRRYQMKWGNKWQSYQ